MVESKVDPEEKEKRVQKIEQSILIHAKLCVAAENLAETARKQKDFHEGKFRAHGVDLNLVDTAFIGAIKNYKASNKPLEKEEIFTKLHTFILTALNKFATNSKDQHLVLSGKEEAYTQVTKSLDEEVKRLEIRKVDPNLGLSFKERKKGKRFRDRGDVKDGKDSDQK